MVWNKKVNDFWFYDFEGTNKVVSKIERHNEISFENKKGTRKSISNFEDTNNWNYVFPIGSVFTYDNF